MLGLDITPECTVFCKMMRQIWSELLYIILHFIDFKRSKAAFLFLTSTLLFFIV